jgi:hypothetical protein
MGLFYLWVRRQLLLYERAFAVHPTARARILAEAERPNNVLEAANTTFAMTFAFYPTKLYGFLCAGKLNRAAELDCYVWRCARAQGNSLPHVPRSVSVPQTKPGQQPIRLFTPVHNDSEYVLSGSSMFTQVVGNTTCLDEATDDEELMDMHTFTMARKLAS